MNIKAEDEKLSRKKKARKAVQTGSSDNKEVNLILE